MDDRGWITTDSFRRLYEALSDESYQLRTNTRPNSENRDIFATYEGIEEGESMSATVAPVEVPNAPQEMKVEPRKVDNAYVKEIMKDYTQSLYSRTVDDKNVISEAITRLQGRVGKLSRERDSFDKRIQSLRENNDRNYIYDLVNLDMVEKIEMDAKSQTMKVITKPLALPFDCAAIGRVLNVPVGTFEIMSSPNLNTGRGGIADKLHISVKNIDTPAAGGIDHPHVNRTQVCWGEIENQSYTLARNFDFLPLLDYTLAILLNYNPSSAFRELITGWGRNMKKEERVCSQCFKTIEEFTIASNGRKVKCACPRCVTCTEVHCSCLRRTNGQAIPIGGNTPPPTAPQQPTMPVEELVGNTRLRDGLDRMAQDLVG